MAKAGSFALKEIAVDVADGACIALVGPNGSGKTTLLECIAGIRRVESGKIEINGVNVTEAPPERRRVGYVPQDCLLFPHLTVDQNIAFGLKAEGQDPDRLEEIMEWLSVSNLAGRNVRSLSGGEKQRVALARALITRPSVLLLDEPFSGVDRASRKRLLEELRKQLDEASASLGLSTVYVSHDLTEAQLMSSHVAIMNGGRLEQIGSWDRITQAPSSRFVADFMGFNILRGRVTSVDEGLATVEVEGQSILGVANGVMINEQVILVVRPQAVSLSLERDIRKPKWRHCQCNILEGSVTRVRKTGPTAEVSIDAGFPLNSEVNADLVDELDLVVGSRVFVQFRASEVSLLSA